MPISAPFWVGMAGLTFLAPHLFACTHVKTIAANLSNSFPIPFLFAFSPPQKNPGGRSWSSGSTVIRQPALGERYFPCRLYFARALRITLISFFWASLISLNCSILTVAPGILPRCSEIISLTLPL